MSPSCKFASRASARTRVGGRVAIGLALIASTSAMSMERLAPVPDGIGSPGDQAGSAVALFGAVAAVGSPGAQPSPYLRSGAVGIFRQVGGVWQREAVLRPGNPGNDMSFGTSVALGQDLAVVSARGAGAVYTFANGASGWQQVDSFASPGVDEVALSATCCPPIPTGTVGNTLVTGPGTVYVRSGSGWAFQASLTVDAGESLLGKVAIDGDLIAAVSGSSLGPGFFHYYVNFFARSGTTWTREFKIDAGSNASIPAGLAFAISGQTALVGMPGVVNAYVRSNGTWAFQGILDPLTSDPGFGLAVALVGDRAIVASPDDTILGIYASGSVYTFGRTGDVWSREQHLTHPTVGDFSYEFGRSLALSDTSLIAGAPGANTAAGSTGDGTVFSLDNGAWTTSGTLDLGNSHANESFGSAVAASGTTLVVGAANSQSDNVFIHGAAYIYGQSQGQWSFQALLRPPSTPDTTVLSFAGAVAVDGDSAAIGAAYDALAGAVYVFDRDDGTWPLQARLVGGDAGDRFGASVALLGGMLAVGQPGSDATPGVVHLYGLSGTIWTPLAILQASDSANGDGFGSAVAFSGSTLIVGAPGSDSGIEHDAGAAYIFTGTGATWAQQARILAPVPVSTNGFGTSVALAGDTAVIAQGSTRSGVYVYVRSGTSWTLESTLTPPGTGPAPASFGRSISISATADRVVVGEPSTAGYGTHGLVHVFARQGTDWPLLLTLQGTPQQLPHTPEDSFGASTTMLGEDVIIGATEDGAGGAVFMTPVGDALFANGFESPP